MDCVSRKSICLSQGIEPFDELAIPPHPKRMGNPAIFVEKELEEVKR